MNERILVVDDDQNMLTMCERALEQAERGYAAVAVSSAEQARAHLQTEQFNLMILDVRLPQEDGMSLLRYLYESQPDLPVMIISGYPEVANVLEAVRLHVREYLCKPFTVSKFLAAVEASLDNWDA